MNVELISWTNDPIGTCAKAASMCYDSEPSRRIVKGCIQTNHTSVLEHCSFVFKITGVSRALLAQITRHRMASFSVQSQRYCSYDEGDIEFVSPACDKTGWVQNVGDYTVQAYREMLNEGWKAEDARSVLPNAMPTNMVVTMNLRAMMNFMNERLCSNAQKEIRDCANLMKKCILNDCTDLTDEDREIINMVLVPKCEKECVAFCTERKSCGRHKKLTELVTPQ